MNCLQAIELKHAEGTFDASLHLKAQIDQLTGRNEELRKELRETRKEAVNFSNQLAKANAKVCRLNWLSKHCAGSYPGFVLYCKLLFLK